ncbi:hypothetical protein ACFX2J_017724 [Malus domestica]
MKARPFSMLMQSRELSMSLPVVYVNYELLEDYETLKQMGLNVSGCPVYHSIYDDFIWMQKFGDSMFHRHVTVASVWDLVALWLADAEFLPFNDLSYAMELQNKIKVGSSRGRKIILKVRELNDRLTMAEPAFTDQDGLFGRSYYKHLIYGPSKHDDYGSISFPGIDEGIEMSWKSAT